MPAEPIFRNDHLESLHRKCVVFPADGSETRMVDMVARTVTDKDISQLRLSSRCVDMTTTFRDDYCKLRVERCRRYRPMVRDPETYLLFYNLSPKLPINLNVARLNGVTPSYLKINKRLFWRGDVVVLKVQPESKVLDFMVKALDAHQSDFTFLEECLRERFREGSLEQDLHADEAFWRSYLSIQSGPRKWWGVSKRIGIDLKNLNELRSIVGRPPIPIPRQLWMKSYVEHVSALRHTFKSAVGLHSYRKGPPKLSQDLERRIFEICALEDPGICTVLVLVAKRVHAWVDPLLIATVDISLVEPGAQYIEKSAERLKMLLAKLTNGKPVEYYARHVKNLAIPSGFSYQKELDCTLAICTGVENLAIFGGGSTRYFLENPQAGHHLRRLTVSLQKCFPWLGPALPAFYHPCFANLTHLHLLDDIDDIYWRPNIGWENLATLTHFACAYSERPKNLLEKMPGIQYIAVVSYQSINVSLRGGITSAWMLDRSYYIAQWGVRVVGLQRIPKCDWQRGPRGWGDFWEVVEQEVEMRLQERSVE